MNNHLHFSTGVSKLGAGIPSLSLPAVVTCRSDAPCFKSCYARRGRFCFKRNRELLEKNIMIWKMDPVRFEEEVCSISRFYGYFRWHSSGDIPDAEYLHMMVRVAQRIPSTSFLCFTKRFEFVNDFLSEHGSFPPNLKIVLSAWGEFLPPNPYNLPVAYVRLKKQQTSIPMSAFQCQKFCGDCVSSGKSCWDLKPGQAVVFDEH